MEIKKDDIFNVIIEDLSESGEGIGKVDGYTLFIKDAVIGDTIEVKIMKTKKSYGFAKLLRLVKPSLYRVEAPCPVAKQCGGCQLQALSYKEQLRYKERKVLNNIKRIGKFETIEVLPIIGMEQPLRYRNKAQFPLGVDKDGTIIAGFYASRTHDIISQDDCLLGVDINKVVLEKVKSFMHTYHLKPYDEVNHTGLVRHVLVRTGFRTQEVMVCLIINGTQLENSNKLVDNLLEIPNIKSISYCVNRNKTNVIMGDEIINLYGKGYITDYIGDVKYQISPKSFYQINPVQTEKLYGIALKYAGLTGKEVVWDLYCGIGTISLFLAQNAKMVYGVEIVDAAIEDARENAKINGIENVEFFVGKAEEVLPEQYKKNQVYADVIVVDPPRKGCDVICLDTIVEMAPKRVIYVSCDSATLARDMRYLCDRGYEVKGVQMVDMFGMTVHVECVVKLCRVEK